jgi:hypothetical protein
MYRRAAVLASFLFAVPLADAAPALKTPKRPPSPVVGVWRATSRIVYGHHTDLSKRLEFVFRADGKVALSQADGLYREGSFETDAKGGTIRYDLGPVPEKGLAHCKFLGIFKVEGDSLTLASAEEADGAPTGFASPKGSRILLYEFKAVRREDVHELPSELR